MNDLITRHVEPFPQTLLAHSAALAMKAATDRDRRPGRFIVTGSASPLRLGGLADSMAGRVLRLSLYGFPQGETRGLHDDFVARGFTADNAELVRYRTETTHRDYAEMIGRGGYPDAQQLPDPVRHRWLDSYLAGIVRRGLTELRRQVDAGRTETLLPALARRQPGELVDARVATGTAIPAATVTGYLDLLTGVGLLATIGPFIQNLSNREVGRYKSLLLDFGLAARLARVTSEQLAPFDHGEARGSFLVCVVTAELLRQKGWTAQEFELFHCRDRSGAEVNLVAKPTGRRGRVVGIEVKASTSFCRRHFDGLRTLRDRLGDRFAAGIVPTTGTDGNLRGHQRVQQRHSHRHLRPGQVLDERLRHDVIAGDPLPARTRPLGSARRPSGPAQPGRSTGPLSATPAPKVVPPP